MTIKNRETNDLACLFPDLVLELVTYPGKNSY